MEHGNLSNEQYARTHKPLSRLFTTPACEVAFVSATFSLLHTHLVVLAVMVQKVYITYNQVCHSLVHHHYCSPPRLGANMMNEPYAILIPGTDD